ncbi:FMN-binding protein [Ectobacillus polymachus]|uniref:FMN-binding protein n=1 Tax=Ectobacillus polymachus TaxID=1508806 RepID=UPI003A88D44F
MAKMGNKMIVLCSAAIGIIYTSGYVSTQSAASTQIQNTLSSQAQSTQTNRSVDTSQSSTSQVTTPASSSQTSSAIVKKTYKDGTYTGTGTNRIGSVEVAVTIQNDKITSVDITNCTTSYPESYIQDLPSEVVSRQSAQVDVVSGATKSTNDFQDAVTEALQKAKNA